MNITFISPVDFFKEGEYQVAGGVLLERIRKIKYLANQLDAEKFLQDNDLILKEYKDFILIFAGTVRHDSCDYLYVPYLCWRNNEWRMYFLRIDAFGSPCFCRFVCK